MATTKNTTKVRILAPYLLPSLGITELESGIVVNLNADLAKQAIALGAAEEVQVSK